MPQMPGLPQPPLYNLNFLVGCDLGLNLAQEDLGIGILVDLEGIRLIRIRLSAD
jgi:hypothetical protein